jgi:hypothetical protein
MNYSTDEDRRGPAEDARLLDMYYATLFSLDTVALDHNDFDTFAFALDHNNFDNVGNTAATSLAEELADAGCSTVNAESGPTAVDASALATGVDRALDSESELLTLLFGQPADGTDGARNSVAGSLPTVVDADAFAISLDPAFEFPTPVFGQLADGTAMHSVSRNIPQRKTIKADCPLKVGLSRY